MAENGYSRVSTPAEEESPPPSYQSIEDQVSEGNSDPRPTSPAEEDGHPPSYQSIEDQDTEDPAQPAATISAFRKFAYGVGHIFNDLCASMWFTYLVLFLNEVVELSSLCAGVLILIGQVTDAVATPFIGFLCDKTHLRYGRRKFCHLVGTIMVAVSFFFIWHTCLLCNDSTPLAAKIVYFSIPICIFQFGWASVQISHLSLIPELTKDRNERVGLTTIRYAFTILSNIGVYVTIFLLLLLVNGSTNAKIKIPPKNALTYHLSNFSTCVEGSPESADGITPHDVWIFSGTALGIIAIGGFFSVIFQIGTREPYIAPQQRKTEYAEGRKIKWYLWFINPQFYLVAVIYMCTRLMNNIIQAYTPLYLLESLELSKASVAIGPLVIFVSGFLATLLLKVLNRVIGRYMVYFLGVACIWGGLIWYQLMDPPQGNIGMNVLVYGSTVFVGVGGATILVTSLSMVADLIDNATGSAAFVYGLMSFTDKLSSGVVIQIIQSFHPCVGRSMLCCAEATFYRNVLVFVPGAASALATVALALLVLLLFVVKRRQKGKPLSARQRKSSKSKAAPPIPMGLISMRDMPNGGIGMSSLSNSVIEEGERELKGKLLPTHAH